MNFLKSAVVLFSVVVCIQGAKLPSYLSKCKKDLAGPELGKCILDSGNNGLKTFVQGDSSIHLVKVDPLSVPKLLIDVDGNLKIDLTDAVITGVSEAVITDSSWDFENKKVEFKFTVPRANLQGTYDIAGRILILPINGQGPCNITYVNGNFDFKFDYDLTEKGDKHYVAIKKNSLTYEVDRVYFQLDNLFGGDKRLGEEMSKFLDENWKEVNGEIGVRVGDALGEVFATVLGEFFKKVPMEELFE